MRKSDFVLQYFDGVCVPDCTKGGSTVLIMKELERGTLSALHIFYNRLVGKND